MTPGLPRGELAAAAEQGGRVRVVVAAPDVRVRRALSGLLELQGHSVVGAVDTSQLLPQLDAELSTNLVVLELNRRAYADDLKLVRSITQRGYPVIAITSDATRCASVVSVGAQACLDKSVDFPERLARALRAVAVPRMPPPT
jgi:DNA-binding NtrC family response regulator